MAQILRDPEQSENRVLDPANSKRFNDLLNDAGQHRVIYLGEIHDRYDHHLNQLQIIRGLQQAGHDLAIGLEAFQEPFQTHLDAYLAGHISETEMLRRTEYYDRWRFDFRLYRDILRFAREHRIPLIALNAPSELVNAVSSRGIDGLDPAQRSRLPDRIPPVDAAYKRRLHRAFEMHRTLPESRFERFLEVQSVWDEYMAAVAAAFLEKNPQTKLVVLAGSAHVMHTSAIPGRVRRRYAIDDTIIVTAPFKPVPGVKPDYVLATRDIQLDRRGQTGMTLQEVPEGVVVKAVKSPSAAGDAGLSGGDRILSINGLRISSLTDVRLALTDSAPGDQLTLETEGDASGSGRIQKRILTLR
jgi:uncharacterized iron-regulated protein